MQIRKRFLKEVNLVVYSVPQLNKNPDNCIQYSVGGIMKTLAIIYFVLVSMALTAWEVGDVITTDYSWTDSNGETQSLFELTESGKTVFWFKGEDWYQPCVEAAEFLSSWIQDEPTDSIYFCSTMDWSSFGYGNLVFSDDIGITLSDFSNGLIPQFIVIGNLNKLMYNGNILDEGINTIPEAYNSFVKMLLLNPVNDQTMFIGDTLTHNISDLFMDPQNDPITLSVSNNSNVAAIDAYIINDDLYITAIEEGIASITIMGETTGETIEYTFEIQVYDINDNYLLIIDLDDSPKSLVLKASLEEIYPGGNIFLAKNWATYPMENADAIFILLGVYNVNYVLDEAEVIDAVEYLNNGGNIYMEGGDTWAYNEQTSLHEMFSINGISDGNSDLISVTGEDFLSGITWDYSGANAYIDHIEPAGTAITVFTNSSVGYNCGVSYDSGFYKTVGTSFEITGLGGSNTSVDAIWKIMEFFELVGSPMATPKELVVDEEEAIASWIAPDSTSVIGFNVYLNNDFVAYTEELTYHFENLISGTEYTAGVTALYCEGESEMVTAIFTYSGVDANSIITPKSKLIGNHPNPFNPETTIKFAINEDQHVNISIYNVSGQLVKILVDLELPLGEHAIVWNGVDRNSKKVSSGMYFLRMNATNFARTHKIMLIK